MANWYLRATDIYAGVVLASPNDLTPGTENFSYCGWLKTTQSRSFGIVAGGNSPQDIDFGMSSSGLGMFWMYDYNVAGLQVRVDGSVSVNDGKWHFLAVTVDRAGNALLYTDGNTDGSVDVSKYLNDDFSSFTHMPICCPLYFFGSGYDMCVDQPMFFKGVILTLTQIRAIYNNRVGIKAQTLFNSMTSDGWYSELDDGTGSTTVTGWKKSAGEWSPSNGTISESHTVWVPNGIPISDIDSGVTSSPSSDFWA